MLHDLSRRPVVIAFVVDRIEDTRLHLRKVGDLCRRKAPGTPVKIAEAMSGGSVAAASVARK